MAVTSSTLFKTVIAIVHTVSKTSNVFGTLVVMTLVAIVNYDIVARGVFNAPLPGAVEVVQFSLVMIVFLQLPDVVRSNRLTRSDGLLGYLGNHYPRAERVLRAVLNMIALVVMFLIFIAVQPQLVQTWNDQTYFGIPGVFTAPYWPLKLATVFSALLCTLIFALKVIGGDTLQQGSSKEDEA